MYATIFSHFSFLLQVVAAKQLCLKRILGMQNGFLVNGKSSRRRAEQMSSAELHFSCDESMHDNKYFTIFIAVIL